MLLSFINVNQQTTKTICWH